MESTTTHTPFLMRCNDTFSYKKGDPLLFDDHACIAQRGVKGASLTGAYALLLHVLHSMCFFLAFSCHTVKLCDIIEKDVGHLFCKGKKCRCSA